MLVFRGVNISLPQTNILHLPLEAGPQKETRKSSNHPFSDTKMLVSGRVRLCILGFACKVVGKTWKTYQQVPQMVVKNCDLPNHNKQKSYATSYSGSTNHPFEKNICSKQIGSFPQVSGYMPPGHREADGLAGLGGEFVRELSETSVGHKECPWEVIVTIVSKLVYKCLFHLFMGRNQPTYYIGVIISYN